MAQKLKDLQLKVHLRKVRKIEAQTRDLRQQNEVFDMREQNILINGLQFINEVGLDDSQKKSNSNGIDRGHVCILDPKDLEKPEFREFISEL